MKDDPKKLTPDGKPARERSDGDGANDNSVYPGQDPRISGDTSKGGYANTDEATPDDDGLVRRGDAREPPLI